MGGKVRGEGIEPSTNWLKANCSTAELPAPWPKGRRYLFTIVGPASLKMPVTEVLHKDIQIVLRALDVKGLQPCIPGAANVEKLIVADMQAFVRHAAGGASGRVKDESAGFGRAHFAGDDHRLEEPGQTMPRENAAQSPVKIRENEQSATIRKACQRVRNILKHGPRIRSGVVGVQRREQFLDPPGSVLRPGRDLEGSRHEFAPPGSIVISGGDAAVLGLRQAVPRLAKCASHGPFVDAESVRTADSGINRSNRLAKPDERPNRIESDRPECRHELRRAGC